MRRAFLAVVCALIMGLVAPVTFVASQETSEMIGTPEPIVTIEAGAEPNEPSATAEVDNRPSEGQDSADRATPSAEASTVTGTFAETSTVTILFVDETEAPFLGGCVLIYEHLGDDERGNLIADKCDGDDGDTMDGRLVFPDFPLGAYVAVFVPTESFGAPDEYFGVVAGEDRVVTLRVTSSSAVTVRLLDEDYDPFLGGGCVAIYVRLSNGERGLLVASQCDGENGDMLDGQLSFTDFAPGNYIAALVATGEYGASDEPFSVAAGEAQIVILIVIPLPKPTVIVHKVDENGDPVPGVCFTLSFDREERNPEDEIDVECDSWEDAGDGTILFYNDLEPGRYVLFEDRMPIGYRDTGPHPFEITDATVFPLEIWVVNESLGGGTLIIEKLDENIHRLPGACFALFQAVNDGTSEQYIASACDWHDGRHDGIIQFTHLNPGEYILLESHAPDGYIVGGRMTVHISGEEPTIQQIENVRGGAALTIRKVDQAGNLLPGACFSVYRDNGSGQLSVGSFIEGLCDTSDGANDGLSVFKGLPAGAYLLLEGQPPAGYAPLTQLIRFEIGEQENDLQLDVQNIPASQAYGSLIIRKVDPDGNLLPGSCFELRNPATGNAITSQPHCDGGFGDMDGANDGAVTFTNNVRGVFLIRETTAPEGYEAGGDVTVIINPGQTVTITVVNAPKEEAPAEETPEAETPEEEGGGVTALPKTGLPGAEHRHGSEALWLALVGIAVLALARRSLRWRAANR